MKHVPQRHQSVAPPPAFIAVMGIIVVFMVIIYGVVAMAMAD